MPIDISQIQNLLKGGDQSQNVIYNQYQRSDFEVGQDNLNPLREVDMSSNIDIDGLRVQLYAAYKDRLEALAAAGIDTSRQGTGADASAAGAAGELGLPYEDKTNVAAPFVMREVTRIADTIPSAEEDVMQILGALEGLLGADALTTDGLPFDICDDRGGGFNPGGGGDYGGTGTNEGGASGGGSGSGAGLGSGSGLTSGQSSLAAKNNAIDPDTAECLQMEIEFIGILLALLAILAVMMAIDRYVLAIIFPIIRIATLVAQVWVNPAAIAEIIQELAGMGMAFAIDVIAKIVQMIIDNLNLDCLVQGPLNSIRSLVGSAVGVAGAAEEIGAFVGFGGESTSQTWQAIQGLRETTQAFDTDRTLSDVLGDIKSNVDLGGEFQDRLDEDPSVRQARHDVERAREGVRVTRKTADTVKDFFADGYETY